MKFCVENIKDISKYFQGTFVKFTDMRGVYADGSECPPAEELVHTIDSIQGATIRGKRWEHGEYVPYQFLLYGEHEAPAPEVEFILPKKGWFNTKHGATLLFRVPARQYRRGVCDDNTSILSLLGDSFNPQSVSVETLHDYIQKPKFGGFGMQLRSYAVSKRLAVSTTGKIYVDKISIGTINYDAATIQALPLFHSELEQVLKDHGQVGIYTIVKLTVPKRKPRAGKGFPATAGNIAPKTFVVDEVQF